jgi:hypothetical protein
MAGYSGTPLWRKLGIASGHRVALVGAPAGFERALRGLPAGVELSTSLRGTAARNVIVLFTRRRADLERRFAALAARLEPNGGLWIAWPKKASGVATDLGDGVVRAVGLSGGLVDNKVCAVDDTWSGLRFVVRRADRPRAVRRG